MRRGRRKGPSKDKVFGCDLLEHLAASSQEIPLVLRCCSEFIEEYGIVDGIYRLSGVSSNTQKLRGEFDTEGVPDLSKDVYRQDIHCVSSLCKAYFRELPNPLLTYQLYDKFADAVAVQLEEERLVKIKEVLKDLPLPHYRTLEYLMRHLVKMATFASQTNMHARNLAIVWAPNLLRSKDIEATGLNGTAAFMEVRVQSIVVEFILTHVSQLFPSPGHTPERRKSLPSPSAMSSQEDPFFRAIPFNVPSALSPGNGPPAMRPYHAIIEGTDKRKGSLKGRKWKSIFNLGGRLQDPRRKNKSLGKEKMKVNLRPAKSMDSLSSVPYTPEGTRQHPSSSPLTEPSPTLGREAGGGLGGAVGGASSGYAVTYRRGGGACVSVVSGGGVQGTYSRLDSGEHSGDSLPPQPRSPAMASRAERRAGMHISGPFSVTVPLHITSGLALGVLQGGGLMEEDRAQREESESPKEEGVPHTEEDGSHTEEDRAGKTEEDRERDESGKDGAEQKKTVEDESEYEIVEPFSMEETEPSGVAEEDYVDMRRTFPAEDQDSQLPLDFQDTFGFLDLMDSSTYSQVNEFSVEPPCYEEVDDDEEESGYPGDPPSSLTPELPAPPPQTHRSLTTDPHGHPCKSHSLPYKSRPFLPALSCSSSSEDEEDGEEDEEEEEGSDEEENILFYSLPSSLQFQAARQREGDTRKRDTHPTAGLEQSTNACTDSIINGRSSVNAAHQSEGELEHSDHDSLVAQARPGEIGDDGTDEEDSLELKKMEEGEATSGERDHTVALTNAHGLGCGVGEEQEQYEDHYAPEQGKRDHTAEHSTSEVNERDHTAGHSDSEVNERDHTAGHSDSEVKERDHTAGHSDSELKERDHTSGHSDSELKERDRPAEHSTSEVKERDHTAEHNDSEVKERDHTAEHSATEQSERDHAAEHKEPKEADLVADQSDSEIKERDQTAEHSTTEQNERDHTAEHNTTEQNERDHTAEHSTTEQNERDHTAEHSTTEQNERDHTAEHSTTEQNERDHTAEHSTTEQNERDHTAEHSTTEQNERDHTAEHNTLEQNERDHTAEHSTTEQNERDHTAEHSTTEQNERDHTAEHSTTEQNERDHTAEHSTTEQNERDHTAEHNTLEQNERDHTAEHSTTEQNERDHTAEHSTTEQNERDHTAEHSTTEQNERDHTAEHSTLEQNERAHTAEHAEPKETDHAAELNATQHRDRLHNDTGPESTVKESHHGSSEGCHGDLVNISEQAAEPVECNVSPEPRPLPLPETPQGPHTCTHLLQEPQTTPVQQDDACREEVEEREHEAGKEGRGGREEEELGEERKEKYTESHNQLDVLEKEERKEKREESQDRDVASEGPEEGRREKDLGAEKGEVQKHETQVNARERDQERSNRGEEDAEQGVMQGSSPWKEGWREGRSLVLGPGMARKLVYTRQASPKLYQAKAVPVVPPKPQLCKLTALTLRQQRERERGREGEGYRDGGGKRDVEGVQRCEGEKEEQKRREVETERERDGENEGELERWGEDGRAVDKEMKRNSGVSMCFDVAVARATERRGRERERGKDGHTESRRGAEKD